MCLESQTEPGKYIGNLLPNLMSGWHLTPDSIFCILNNQEFCFDTFLLRFYGSRGYPPAINVRLASYLNNPITIKYIWVDKGPVWAQCLAMKNIIIRQCKRRTWSGGFRSGMH